MELEPPLLPHRKEPPKPPLPTRSSTIVGLDLKRMTSRSAPAEISVLESFPTCFLPRTQ